ncbi:hypothetical protein ACTXT7_016280, partial [Hymenolepis weldensis]
SSTDVEEYIQNFRQTLKENKSGPSNLESRQSSPFSPKNKVISDRSVRHTVRVSDTSSITNDKRMEISFNFGSKSEFEQTDTPWQPSKINLNQDHLDPLKETWNTTDSVRFQHPFQDITEACHDWLIGRYYLFYHRSELDPNYQEMEEDIV